jgi:CRISPR-associated protein Csc2
MGSYAHLIVLRETDSYALFQTDGELNTARVRAGRSAAHKNLMTRLIMFKRKQTTPERLVGRELLRHYGKISAAVSDGKKVLDDAGVPICDYNVRFCMQCPDCISYGFAIGDSGSEKAKVLSDTAYSITAYEESHETFTLNAPYESGTMSRDGLVTSRINEQDHVKPQTLFPAIITVRDLTPALFEYVLTNILRTRRYGAQTTRTGTLTNHLVAIVLANGEITSNLRLTQAVYDGLMERKAIERAQPIDPTIALEVMGEVLDDLVAESHVHTTIYRGDELQTVLTDLQSRVGKGDEGVRTMIDQAYADSQAYYTSYVMKDKDKGGQGNKKG